MSALSLLILGVGPALALLVARRVASSEAAAMRRHRQALSVLGEITGGSTSMGS